MLSSREKEIFSRDVLLNSFDLDLAGVDLSIAAASGLAQLEDLLSLNEPDVREKRSQHFAIPGTGPDDYAEKFYLLPNGKQVLAGIRHLSGDVENPFVHFALPFAPDAADIAVLRSFAKSEFSKFAPRHISFSQRSLDLSGVARCHVVGRIQAIKNRPRIGSISELSFRPFSFETDLAWYKRAYDEFHRAAPHLKSWVPITDEEDLRRCLNDGMMFVVEIEGQVAGVVAAERRELLGLTGAYMNEILLVPPFKRRGLAAGVQRGFIDLLPEDIELIWGTIDAKNISSMKTALRVGRQIIRSEYFLACDPDRA